MTVIAIIAALLIEQWRPLGDLKVWFAVLEDMAARLERAFNAEQDGHGTIAWAVGVGPAFVLAIAVHSLLYLASPSVFVTSCSPSSNAVRCRKL